MDKKGRLQLNKETRKYECAVLIQVEEEIFRRRFLTSLQEDDTLDLSDMRVIEAKAEKLADPLLWLGRPHVLVTPIGIPHEQNAVQRFTTQSKMQFSYPEIEREMRDRAKYVPPYLWDEKLRAPIPAGSSRSVEKQQVYYLRSYQLRALKVLWQEYKRGEFRLMSDAQRLQEAYDTEQDEAESSQLQVVASAVNGVRFR